MIKVADRNFKMTTEKDVPVTAGATGAKDLYLKLKLALMPSLLL